MTEPHDLRTIGLTDGTFPAEPVPPLRGELGYSCYALSYQEKSQQTIAFIGDGVRVHLGLAAAARSSP